MVSIQKNERSKNQLHSLSVKSWSDWCLKNGYELFLLDTEILDPPQWNKLLIFELLEKSGIDPDRILYVDADTIVHPNMPDIFKIFPRDTFCGVRNFGSMDWVIRSIENYSKYIFDGYMIPWENYINSGFMLFSKEHRRLFDWCLDLNEKRGNELREVEKLGVGKDQPIINFGIPKNNIKFMALNYAYNMQDLMRFELLGSDMLHTRHGWVYHFNAGVKPTPAYWMQLTYDYLNQK